MQLQLLWEILISKFKMNSDGYWKLDCWNTGEIKFLKSECFGASLMGEMMELVADRDMWRFDLELIDYKILMLHNW